MLKGLLSEVVSTEDITVSRPGMVPALMDCSLGEDTNKWAEKTFVLQHDSLRVP